MALPQAANFGKVTVSAGYNNAAVSVALISGHGAKLPDTAGGIFYLIWWNWTDYKDPSDDPLKEIIKVTARVGDVLTIERGQRSTTAQNHNLAGRTYKMFLSFLKEDYEEIEDMIDDANSDIAALEAEVAGKMDIVHFADAEELTSGVDGFHWSLAHTPISGSVKLYAVPDGIKLRAGAGNDYTISGVNIVSTSDWTVNPPTADYRY